MSRYGFAHYKKAHFCHVHYFFNMYHKYIILRIFHIWAFPLSLCWWSICNISACDSHKSLFFMQVLPYTSSIYVNQNNTKVYTVRMSTAF